MKIRELIDDTDRKQQLATASAADAASVRSTASQQIQAADATAAADAAAAETAKGREAKALQAIGPTLVSGAPARMLDSPDGVNVHVTMLNPDDTDVPDGILPPEPGPGPAPEVVPEPVPNPDLAPAPG